MTYWPFSPSDRDGQVWLHLRQAGQIWCERIRRDIAFLTGKERQGIVFVHVTYLSMIGKARTRCPNFLCLLISNRALMIGARVASVFIWRADYWRGGWQAAKASVPGGGGGSFHAGCWSSISPKAADKTFISLLSLSNRFPPALFLPSHYHHCQVDFSYCSSCLLVSFRYECSFLRLHASITHHHGVHGG